MSYYEQGKEDFKLGIGLTEGRYVLPSPGDGKFPSDYAIDEWQRGWKDAFDEKYKEDE